ncbi:MAG: hypothetical protein AB7L92_00245 [Alphaproteobacteria bacterium]
MADKRRQDMTPDEREAKARSARRHGLSSRFRRDADDPLAYTSGMGEALLLQRERDALRGFAPEGDKYVKTLSRAALRHMDLILSADLQQEFRGTVSDTGSAVYAVGDERARLLQKDDATLATAWPMFSLLSRLPDKSKAAALRAAIASPKSTHEIVLTKPEHTKLQQAVLDSEHRR